MQSIAFKNSNTNKRYYTLDYFYKKKFNSKIFKVPLDLGLTCPNKDGTKGFGGCIYCKSINKNTLSLKEQFENKKNILLNKWPNSKYIAYFNTNTSTYGDLEYLKKSFKEVLTYDNVIGINIATRCDSITDDCFNYLKELNKKTYLTIELGLQTMHDKTAKFINRGHDLKEFEDMYNKLKENNFNIVIHIINGLPYENKEMMLETAKYLNKLKPTGIKIHMLFIENKTTLANIYQKKPFHILTKDEYIDIVCDQLKLLNEDIIINRITGDPDKESLIEPTWVIKKFCVLNDIDKELVKRNSWQGKRSD